MANSPDEAENPAFRKTVEWLTGADTTAPSPQLDEQSAVERVAVYVDSTDWDLEKLEILKRTYKLLHATAVLEGASDSSSVTPEYRGSMIEILPWGEALQKAEEWVLGGKVTSLIQVLFLNVAVSISNIPNGWEVAFLTYLIENGALESIEDSIRRGGNADYYTNLIDHLEKSAEAPSQQQAAQWNLEINDDLAAGFPEPIVIRRAKSQYFDSEEVLRARGITPNENENDGDWKKAYLDSFFSQIPHDAGVYEVRKKRYIEEELYTVDDLKKAGEAFVWMVSASPAGAGIDEPSAWDLLPIGSQRTFLDADSDKLNELKDAWEKLSPWIQGRGVDVRKSIVHRGVYAPKGTCFTAMAERLNEIFGGRGPEWVAFYKGIALSFASQEDSPDWDEILPDCKRDVERFLATINPPWGRDEERKHAMAAVCTPEVIAAEQRARDKVLEAYSADQNRIAAQKMYEAVKDQAEKNLAFLNEVNHSPLAEGKCQLSEFHLALCLKAADGFRQRIVPLLENTKKIKRVLGSDHNGDPELNRDLAVLIFHHHAVLSELDSQLNGAPKEEEREVRAEVELPPATVSNSESSPFPLERLSHPILTTRPENSPQVTFSPGGGGGMDYRQGLNSFYAGMRNWQLTNCPKWAQRVEQAYLDKLALTRNYATNIKTEMSQAMPLVQTLQKSLPDFSARFRSSLVSPGGATLPPSILQFDPRNGVEGLGAEEAAQLSAIQSQIDSFAPNTPEQTAAKETTAALSLAGAIAYFDREEFRGKLYADAAQLILKSMQVGYELKEVLLTLSPLGPALDMYLAVVGRDTDGRRLTDLERGIAAFCALTAGFARKTEAGLEVLRAIGKRLHRADDSISSFGRSMDRGSRLARTASEVKPILGDKWVRSGPPIPTEYVAEFRTFREATYEPGYIVFQAQRTGQTRAGRWFTPIRPLDALDAETQLSLRKVGNDAHHVKAYQIRERVSGYEGMVKDGSGYQFFIPKDVPLEEVIEDIIF
jgi:hypothetical protein